MYNDIEITKRISFERPDVVCRQLHCYVHKKYLQFIKAITKNTHYTGKGYILTYLSLINTGEGSTMQNSYPFKYGYSSECAVLSFGRFLIRTNFRISSHKSLQSCWIIIQGPPWFPGCLEVTCIQH